MEMTQPIGNAALGLASTQSTEDALALKRIGAALRGLRYGSVTVIVQDGVVVQVDRTEKLRLSATKDGRR